MKAPHSGKRATVRRSAKRITKNMIWWLRFSIASFLAFLVLSVVFHPTSYVLGYYRTYALVPSIFGSVKAQIASLFAFAVFLVWMIGWNFLWYGRKELRKPHAKVVRIASWVVPSAVAYMWIASTVFAVLGLSRQYITTVIFTPLLFVGCLIPVIFIWRLQNSDERILSLSAFFIGVLLTLLFVVASLAASPMNPFVEILITAYLGLLSASYILTLFRLSP